MTEHGDHGAERLVDAAVELVLQRNLARSERDRAVAEVAQVRAIVDAAVAWRSCGSRGLGSHAEEALDLAVDAYLRSAHSGTRGSGEVGAREPSAADPAPSPGEIAPEQVAGLAARGQISPEQMAEIVERCHETSRAEARAVRGGVDWEHVGRIGRLLEGFNFVASSTAGLRREVQELLLTMQSLADLIGAGLRFGNGPGQVDPRRVVVGDRECSAARSVVSVVQREGMRVSKAEDDAWFQPPESGCAHLVRRVQDSLESIALALPLLPESP